VNLARAHRAQCGNGGTTRAACRTPIHEAAVAEAAEAVAAAAAAAAAGQRSKATGQKENQKKRTFALRAAAEKNRASPLRLLNTSTCHKQKDLPIAGRLFFLPPRNSQCFSIRHTPTATVSLLFVFHKICTRSPLSYFGPPAASALSSAAARMRLATPVPPPQRSNSSCSIASRPRTPKMRPKHLGDISSAIRTCLP
jgi:hypothetical protein